MTISSVKFIEEISPAKIYQNYDGSWDFWGQDTQYSTHIIHPYVASLIPQVPRKILDIYANSETRILDPFVGGGSVVVESYLKNINSSGFDINPLAQIISAAKTTHIPFKILQKIEANIDDIFCQAQFSFVPKPKNFQMEYWFKPYMFEPLSKLKSATQEIVNNSPDEYQEKIKNLLSCIFSNTIRSVSLTYRNEIKLRRLQNEDLRKFNPDVFQIFKARMSQAFERVSHLPPTHKPAHVYQGDVRLIFEEDNSFDLVITSPPYGDIRRTIPYDTFSRNMLYWLGYPEAEIKNIAKLSLGAKSKVSMPPISKTLLNALNMMEDLQLMKEAIWFYNDYYEAFKEITRVTSQRIIVVIGHRILNHVLFDNAAILTELMTDLGWYLEKSYQRKIKGKRIHPKMAFGYNSKGGTIDTESILVFAPNS